MRLPDRSGVDIPPADRSLVDQRGTDVQSIAGMVSARGCLRCDMRFCLHLVALTLFACDAPAQVIALPTPPPLTEAGRDLILEFETGGRGGYDQHPEWPGGASGVTIGIGYDLGYYSQVVIESDWKALQTQSRVRLERVSGKTGQRARAILPTVRDIFIEWAIATDVFDRVDVAREFASAKRVIPGFEDLRPNAQAAWISLGFNRGWGFSGPNRVEMRLARDLVSTRDYEGMARQFVKMKRVWTGTSIELGMYRRRDAEAKLLLTP